MPLYDYECEKCGVIFEAMGREDRIYKDCHICGGLAKKIFTKLTTVWKGKDRKWGTSFYRKHDKGERVGESKMPTFSPLLKKKGEKDGSN